MYRQAVKYGRPSLATAGLMHFSIVAFILPAWHFLCCSCIVQQAQISNDPVDADDHAFMDSW